MKSIIHIKSNLYKFQITYNQVINIQKGVI